MQLKGTHVLPASRERIWALLMDPNTLAKVTPGISRLDPIGEDKFKAIAEVKIGPVNGSFTGDMEVLDKVSPESFTLKMKQESKIGNVQAKGNISLKSIDEKNTEVEFSGKAQLSGLLARTGQRVLSGVARSLTNQFFKAIEEELENAS